MAIKVTVITSDKPRRLTKRITLKNEELVTEAGGHMVRGTYAVREFETLAEFAEMLTTLRTNEALGLRRTQGLRRRGDCDEIQTRDNARRQTRRAYRAVK